MKKPGLAQRKIFWAFIGGAILVLVVSMGVLPLMDAQKKMEEEIALKRKVIQRYDEFLQNRKTIEDDLQKTNRQYEEIQKKLLPGETPQLGAAALQEIVKKLADKNGIFIRSFKIPEPKETAPFRRVSVQIDFNPVSNILSLGQFLHDLENHEKKLMITEIDLLIFNIRSPNTIQGNLVVTGLMKGIPAPVKEKGKEGKA